MLTENSIVNVNLVEPGLAPTFKSYEEFDGTPIIPQPAITDHGNGWYSFDIGTLTKNVRWQFNDVPGYLTVHGVMPVQWLSIAEKQEIADEVSSDFDVNILPILEKILGLSHSNYRIFDVVHNTKGRVVSSRIRTYPTQADAIADTNHIAEYDQEASFDGTGVLMTSFIMTEN